MVLITAMQVTELLGVSNERFERLIREKLLISKDKDAEGNALFDKKDVEKYKTLAERLGRI